MSGRDRNGGGDGGGDFNPPCDELQFEAQLTSPQPGVVAGLEVGEVLEIAVANMKGQIVVQVLKNGQVAGGLAGPDVTKLRNCVDRGHEYKATVRAINGGQVRVLVEHIW